MQNTTDITIPSQPATVPFNRNTYEENVEYEATVTGLASGVNNEGRPYVTIKFNLNGSTESLRRYICPAKRVSTLNSLTKAFGIQDLEQIGEIVGKKCNLSAKEDTFNGVPRVAIAYFNPFNPNANEKVDFAAIAAAMKAEPAKAPEEIAF